MKQELTAPIKQVALAGIGVGGQLVFVGGRHELPIFFFHLAEQVVQFGGVLKFQELLDLPPRVGEAARERR